MTLPSRPFLVFPGVLIAGLLVTEPASAQSISFDTDPCKVSWDTGTSSKFGRLKRKKQGSGSWSVIDEGNGSGSKLQPGLSAGTWEYRLHKFDDSKYWTPVVPVAVTQGACPGGQVAIDKGLAGKIRPVQDKDKMKAAAAMKKPIKLSAIKDVTVQQHGNGLKFRIETHRESKLKLRLHYPPAPANRICDETLKPTAATFALGWKTVWDTHLLNLDPGKNYQFEVCAEDRDGDTYHSKGYSKTLRRRVQVIFERIHVDDDGDAGINKGDLGFGFWAHDQGPQKHSASVGSGNDTHPNKTVTVMGAPDQIQVKVIATDYDCDAFTTEWGPDHAGQGCWEDWAQAAWTVHTGTNSQVTTETTPFQKAATNHGVGFTVHGKVVVTYVP